MEKWIALSVENSRLLIFDLDGTLIDSKLDLANSVNATRASMELEPLPIPVVSSYVGDGAPMLIQRALPDASQEELDRGLRFFLDYYRAHMLDETVLYPGVREALDELHQAGRTLAVLTNKPVRFSVELLGRLELGGHFARIYGGNSFPEKKPHPQGIDTLRQELGFAPEETVMVGDSSVDIRTARNAGVHACGVSWGFKPETFEEHPPDLVIDDLRDLARMVL